MVKVVTFFLIGIAVLALFGRLRWPGGAARAKGLPKPRLCPECGRYNLKGGPCRSCRERQD